MKYTDDDIENLATAFEGASALLEKKNAVFDPVPLELMVACRQTVSQACRQASKEFVRFMVEDAALSKGSAETYANYVWHALLTTGGNPVEALRRRDLQLTTKHAIRAAIRQYALFTERTDLLAELAGLRVKKMLRDREAPTRKTLPPLTEEEVGRILAAIDADKGNPRWPWAWPVLRITIKLGLRAGSDTPWIQREAVIHAAKTGAPLIIWSKRTRQRGLPSKVVAEELEMLANWPGAWNYISDLVAPATPVENRPKSAYSHINAKLKEYSAIAGLDPAEIRSHRFRRAAALRLYEATKDIMLVMAFLGHRSIETTQIYLASNRLEQMDEKLQELYEDDNED